MLKKLCLLLFWIMVEAIPGQAQFVREYKVTERKGFELVYLNFSSYKSLTQLKRMITSDPIYIHGHLLKSNILPDFNYSIHNNFLDVSLVHKNVESDNLGKSITSKLFSDNSNFDHTWDLGLGSNFLYDLDFNLGVGKAEFDLSQIPVSQLKIKSASSDVKVYYGANIPNQVEMDTLLVTLNMGTVEVQKANFANAKIVIIEVSYGKIDLNYSDGLASSCQVIAAVSGGSIHLKLPPESNPVKIRMVKNPLCRTVFPKYLRSIDKETYVTKGYKPSDPKLLELILDVGVGSVTVE
ncbi:hypothetical protein [Algoriphagus boritolerans]|uniref:Adhesin domain-containing protein n=1 Tax=Algoriphagus boritolerans DSM 17298 = JCM 18970 TaxID=1120964 RepID=A0A1H5SZ99_9BACT|nr:hypothetical protein [Algoriphagus boritolerans]SEF55181.1 hypothetical protein SAMN03080598_00570 [Algoriphagus boritolerans DSM 17298 = JCM 18970]